MGDFFIITILLVRENERELKFVQLYEQSHGSWYLILLVLSSNKKDYQFSLFFL